MTISKPCVSPGLVCTGSAGLCDCVVMGGKVRKAVPYQLLVEVVFVNHYHKNLILRDKGAFKN